MQASNDKQGISLWAKIGYVVFAALIALIAYRIGSVWFGHIVVIALTFPMTWFSEPKARRMTRFAYAILVLTLILSTGFIQFLNNPDRVAAIESSGFFRFLFGGTAIRVILSIIIAFLISAALLASPVLLVAYVSCEWILALHRVYGISRRQAMRLLLSLIFNTSYPYFVIENGELTLSNPSGLLPDLGGPGVAVVKPYNAVVFERSGNITRIEGPGMFMTKRFEFIKAIVNLRKQWANFTAENILTKDHVPLTFNCGVGFRIESRQDTVKRVEERSQSFEGGRFTGIIGGDYPVYKRTIYRAVYNTTAAGWKMLSQGAAETQLRRVLREQYSLEDLFRLQGKRLTPDSSIIDKIRGEVQRRVNEISPNWGTTITGFNIKSFEAPEDIKDKLVEMWAAQYAGRSKLLAARSKKAAIRIEAEGDKITEKIKAEGYKEASLIKAEADREVTTIESEAIVEKARAKADAAIIEGRGEAEARVELYRRMLALGPSIDDKATLWTILKRLQTTEEIRTMSRWLLEPDDRHYGRGPRQPRQLLSPQEEESEE